jgi:phosphoserine phosphatase
VNGEGRWSGEIEGEPCFREHKRTHVERWLGRRGLALSALERSWFYSDSINDVALMEAVSDPVAVKPDIRLREHAVAHSWPVLRLD